MGNQSSSFYWSLRLLFSLLCWGLGPVSGSAQIQLGPDRVVLQNITDLNSVSLDWAPAFYEDGLVYVSTTSSGKLRKRLKGKGRDEAYMRLWKAQGDSVGGFELPQLFFGSGGSWHEGPATFDSSFTLCFFSRNAGKSISRAARKAGVGKQQMIFTTVRESDSWMKPWPVGFNDPGSHSAHPALSPDGRLLVFASDRDGGYGGMDLWAVEWEGEGWGQPFNLGNVVNGDGHDLSPFIHQDGTLYYATTVLGDSPEENHLDLVYTRVERGNWMEPQALWEPFNSPYDDFGLIVNQENTGGYFSSTRPGGLGKDDLYRFDLSGPAAAPQLAITFNVSDAQSGEALQGAAIELLNTASVSLETAIQTGMLSDTGLVVKQGKVYMTDPAGQRKVRTTAGQYLVELRREGYLPEQVAVSLDREMILPVRLSPKPVCSRVSLTVLEEESLLPIDDVLVEISAQLSAEQALEVRTDLQGGATICLPCDEIYGLVASRNDYKSRPGSLDLRKEDCADSETNLTLYIARRASTGAVQVAGTPLNPGTVMQLPSVYYASSSHQLSEAAQQDLDRLADLMSPYPDMHIALGSHTDSQGEAGFNQRLSQRRADEAKRYLVESRRINPARIIAIGYGESELRNGCTDGIYCTAAQHRINRRTEVSILDEEGAAHLAQVLSSGQLARRYSRPAATMQPIVPSESNAPAFWVVAGTSSNDGEAQTLLALLKGLGYEEAMLRQVESGSRKLVVAASFADLKDAAALSRKLREEQGLSSYVRKARQ